MHSSFFVHESLGSVDLCVRFADRHYKFMICDFEVRRENLNNDSRSKQSPRQRFNKKPSIHVTAPAKKAIISMTSVGTGGNPIPASGQMQVVRINRRG